MGVYVRALPFVLAQDDQVDIASAIADTMDNFTIRFEPPRISQSLSCLLVKHLSCCPRIRSQLQ